MYFFVKVKIDLNKMPELGRKLQSGELKRNHIVSTFCLANNPDIGLNIWEAESKEMFEMEFNKHKYFYSEVLEISPVIKPDEAQKILMKL
jgi:hypothetical protein